VPERFILLRVGEIAPPESPVSVLSAPPIVPVDTQLAANTPPTDEYDVRVYAPLPRVLIHLLPTGKSESEAVGILLLMKGTSTFSGAIPKATG
jgi:hypothetical protein